MLLMIDNYDSFTYNLVQYLSEIGQEVKVYRNDKITIEEVNKLNPKYIVISPGPCTPNEAGISLELINSFKGKVPILGVCLGHQSIGQAFGGKIIHAQTIMHGKTSQIFHENTGFLMELKVHLLQQDITHWSLIRNHYQTVLISQPGQMIMKLWESNIKICQLKEYSFIQSLY